MGLTVITKNGGVDVITSQKVIDVIPIGWDEQVAAYGRGSNYPQPTGQTTIFRTHDDADVEATIFAPVRVANSLKVQNSLVDFFTLGNTNSFGNLNKFTALDGGQNYKGYGETSDFTPEGFLAFMDGFASNTGDSYTETSVITVIGTSWHIKSISKVITAGNVYRVKITIDSGAENIVDCAFYRNNTSLDVRRTTAFNKFRNGENEFYLTATTTDTSSFFGIKSGGNLVISAISIFLMDGIEGANADEVIDNYTGLMIYNIVQTAASFEAAIDNALASTQNGRSDWFALDINKLESLINYNEDNQGLGYNPLLLSSDLWSSTTLKDDTDNGMLISLDKNTLDIVKTTTIGYLLGRKQF